MPPRQRKKKPEAVSSKAKVIRTESVPILDLKPFHKNPRVGDVGLIAESLEANGQFRAIVVNVGTHTGRPNEILAGNHTWLGARHAGWKDVLASFIDVDDERARRIVLADNRTAEAGSYDEALLAELVTGLPDVSGTGFSEDEVNALLEGIERYGDEADSLLNDLSDEEREVRRKELEERRKKSFMGSDLGDEPDPDDEPEEDLGPNVMDADDELPGAMTFKGPDDVTFDGIGEWGIPKLNPKMLATWDEIPDNLHTWAGSATRDMDQDDITWFYNWGTDSTSGMQDVSKVIPAFYSFDHYFENWWSYPERYAAKLFNSGIKMLVSHDFTPGGQNDPRVEALYAIYKSRWLARYYQDCGFKIIPNITWRDGDRKFLDAHVLKTLPSKTPVISIQLQTLDQDKVAGGVEGYLADINHVFDTIKPDGAIVYVGSQVKKMIDAGKLTFPCETKVLLARQHYLSERMKGRTKKETI